ncbi:hypothetical protein GN956_G2665 [Arapaima gigas]
MCRVVRGRNRAWFCNVSGELFFLLAGRDSVVCGGAFTAAHGAWEHEQRGTAAFLLPQRPRERGAPDGALLPGRPAGAVCLRGGRRSADGRTLVLQPAELRGGARTSGPAPER